MFAPSLPIAALASVAGAGGRVVPVVLPVASVASPAPAVSAAPSVQPAAALPQLQLLPSLVPAPLPRPVPELAPPLVAILGQPRTGIAIGAQAGRQAGPALHSFISRGGKEVLLGMPASAEAAARLGAQVFDGARLPGEQNGQLELPLGDEGMFAAKLPAQPDGLPSYLSIANPEHRKWLVDVIRAAEGSRSGRRVLKQAEKLAMHRGRPITVVVADMRTNNGEFVYDWDVVRMAAHFTKREAAEGAPTLIHELLHVVQKGYGVPTDAFEMELEAYVLTLEMIRELGVTFKHGPFYRSVHRRFQGDLDKFIEWLLKEHKNNTALHGSSFEKYMEKLKKQRANKRRSITRVEKQIKEARAVLWDMERTHQPAQAIKIYEMDIVGPLEVSKRNLEASLRWIERDIALLSTPEGRERYRKFVKRVIEYTRSVHARYPKAAAK